MAVFIARAVDHLHIFECWRNQKHLTFQECLVQNKALVCASLNYNMYVHLLVIASALPCACKLGEMDTLCCIQMDLLSDEMDSYVFQDLSFTFNRSYFLSTWDVNVCSGCDFNFKFPTVKFSCCADSLLFFVKNHSSLIFCKTANSLTLTVHLL